MKSAYQISTKKNREMLILYKDIVIKKLSQKIPQVVTMEAKKSLSNRY